MVADKRVAKGLQRWTAGGDGFSGTARTVCASATSRDVLPTDIST